MTPLPAEIPPLPMVIGLCAVIPALPLSALTGTDPVVTPPVLSRKKLPLETMIVPSVSAPMWVTDRFPESWVTSKVPTVRVPEPASWLKLWVTFKPPALKLPAPCWKLLTVTGVATPRLLPETISDAPADDKLVRLVA